MRRLGGNEVQMSDPIAPYAAKLLALADYLDRNKPSSPDAALATPDDLRAVAAFIQRVYQGGNVEAAEYQP